MRQKLLLLLVLMINLVVWAAPAGVDFSVRAFHLDLRIQVMTMPALKAFAQKIRGQGINTLIMEYEATYPYEHHPLIPGKYAYTRAEIVSFIAFCNKLGLDVIPLQQSFGHVEYILRHYRYKGLREDDEDLSQVCPLEAASDSLLFTELYTELVSTHTSPYIHIGGDETHLLGHCARCRLKAEKEGISRLYIDYINMLCRIVVRLGKRPVLWADIALKYPEALQSLPKGTIFVDWNYGWDLNRFGEHEKLLNSGYEIWGAPALRSSPDNYYLTQWEKHFNNIRDFVPKAREMGYKGIVMTSWSTSGVYSYLYESENSLIDLYAVRHVYPITGFNILLAAYIKSIHSNEPLHTEDFIVDYCSQHYGLSKPQAISFWQALRAAPYEVSEGVVKSPHPLSLKGLADSVAKVAEVLRVLKPLKNKEEFEHYRLMTELRLQYLRFLCIEQEVNAPSFTRSTLPSVRRKLRVLLDNDGLLSQRFIDLNKGSYHLLELQEENQLRRRKMQVLYDHLRY
ncbi:MAG TPA: beta-N-acetylhexosaminidase [Puia sp.]|nr:beta-N-acetylhexosaminidase [Puia sp.]